MIETSNIARIEQSLQYTFGDKGLLTQALTHRSWVEERHPGGNAPAHESNQRLEFLGDAWIDYVIGRWLYDALPEASEGELTQMRTGLVDHEALCGYAARLGIQSSDLRLGRGERLTVDRNKILMGDAMEAIIGAILVDGGPEAATALIRSLLPARPQPGLARKDAIVALGEWHQKNRKQSLGEPDFFHEGPDHARTWTCVLEIDGYRAEGTSNDKQAAKRMACAQMLAALGVPGWVSYNYR